MTLDSANIMTTNTTQAPYVNVTSLENATTNTVVPSPTPMDVFRFVVNTCIQGPICVLGLIGNVMAIIVLFRQKSRATTTIILKGLTIADCLYLVCMFLLMSLRYINKITGTMDAYMAVFPVIFRWFFPQLYVYRTMITWLTVLLTIDRYIVVCRPLQAPRICTKKRAWIEMTIVVVVSLVYNLPRFFEYELTESGVGYSRTSLAKNPYYVFVYRIGLFLVLMYIIPLIVLLIANTSLIITFKKAEKMRSEMSSSQSQQQNKKSITYMVIATVVFFFLANVPAFIAQLLWALYEVFKPDLDHILTYHSYHNNISNILVTLNSAINFVIYCMCSRHFRRVFMTTFCCQSDEKAPKSSMSMTTRATTFTNGSNGVYSECKTHI